MAATERRPTARRARALVLVALFSACSDERPAPGDAPERAAPPPAPAAGVLPAPPDIVLITLDTVRREHLGCYGYFRDTTPRIDALAGEGLLFERALAPMASTLPSHVSMLTGLYPHQHGMTSNWRGASVAYRSEPGRLSVASVLAESGYRTAAFVSAAPLNKITGIHAGFDTYSSPRNTRSNVPAGETTAAAVAWLDREAARPEPFFLWVHYFDPHEPNDPGPPYDSLFATDERQLAWIRERGIDSAALTEQFGRSRRIRRHFLPATRGESEDEVVEITLERVAELMNRYDGELRYMDEEIGTLLDALKRHGRYEDAIVVLVGDHGQSLGENVWIGHGTITDVNTYVPLILRLPRGLVAQPRRIDDLVSLVDVIPTVLARFELPGGAALRAQFEGEDLLSGRFARDRALAQRTDDELRDGESGAQFALHSGRWKLIHRPTGRDELYDMETGGEHVDVASENPEVLARLLAETRAMLERGPAGSSSDGAADAPDPEQLEALKDLGYGGD